MTQKQMIVNYILNFGSISPMEAFADLGVTKLATRISEMKKRGVVFEDEWEERTNRYGKTVRFKRYRFPKHE